MSPIEYPVTTAGGQPAVPLRRYTPGAEWEVVPRTVVSPAPDGSVVYFFDSLSPSIPGDPGSYSDHVARALCRYLSSVAIQRKLEVCDGPYLQILEDDGSTPRDWVMLRALLWAEEFDLVVPVDTVEAVAA